MVEGKPVIASEKLPATGEQMQLLILAYSCMFVKAYGTRLSCGGSGALIASRCHGVPT